MGTKLRSGETLLFVGDSITDCNRRASAQPLGEGYVKFFADFLTIREPDKKVKILNKGISGNRVTDLENRWTDDVLRHRPDWLSILVGINDLHSVLLNAPGAVSPDVFRARYESLLERTRRKLSRCHILLIDPFYISRETCRESFRCQVLRFLPKYQDVVEELSRKYRTLHVPLHAIFQRLLRFHEPDTFCPEPVHPNATGHLVIAESVWGALSS